MAYADLNTIHNPSTGVAPPASWGDQVRDNFEYFNGLLITPGQWASFSTVAIAQTATISFTIVYSRYRKIGRSVRVQGYVNCSSSGTNLATIAITTPFTAAQATLITGQIQWQDASAGGKNYFCPAVLGTTGSIQGRVPFTGFPLGAIATDGAQAWPTQVASGDALLWDYEFESTT